MPGTPETKTLIRASSLTNLLNGVTWEWSWAEEGERGYPGRGERVEGPRGGLVGVKVRGLEGVDGARRHWFYGGSLEQTQKRTGLAKKYYTIHNTTLSEDSTSAENAARTQPAKLTTIVNVQATGASSQPPLILRQSR